MDRVGMLSKDTLRNYKDLSIVVITLSSRSAIEGGVSPEVAFSMSDSYIQQIEELKDKEKILAFTRKAQAEYCLAVRSGADLKTTNPIILRCRDLVNRRIHTKLGVQDIAKAMRVNASYLSQLFSRKQGMPLTEYIAKEKRDLCLYLFKGKESNKKLLMNLDKNFGHISFAKILIRNLILIVRNYNIIEIYNIDNEPQLIANYNNESEINAIDFYEANINESNASIKEDDSMISAKIKEEQLYYIVFIDVNENIIELKFKYNINNKDEQELKVNIKKNLKDIKKINEEYKNKALFNLDFPYYIKNSPNYIVVTTDITCFLLKKQRNI